MTGRPDDNLRGFDETHRGGADRPLTGLLTELAQAGQEVEVVMIDATHLKAHRTASSLRGQKGARASTGGAVSAAPRGG